MTRILIVAAHPDDETIGASSLFAAYHDVTVMHVTDGAPRDRRWWPRDVAGSREAYARTRRREAESALGLAGVQPARILQLGIVDQEAIHVLPDLITLLREAFERLAPELVITHAYEGGHPDHDAVAFAVAAARGDERHPVIAEMALYHGAGGALAVGELLPGAVAPISFTLSPRERVRRDAMIDCYATQEAALAPFRGRAHEAFRPLGRHDFAAPPHAGLLHYERLGFSITGAEWRELARRGHQRTCDPARRAPTSWV